MSMKMMKKAMIGAAGAIALLGAGSAAAQLSPANVPGQWDVVQPSPGTYTFSGPTVLSQSGINISCTLSLTGDVTYVSSSEVTIDVTSGSVMGGGLCGAVSLGGFPWTASIPGSASQADALAEDDVNGTFSGVTVSTFLGSCTGNVAATFNNGSPISADSYFVFDDNFGNCSVDGTLTATTDVNAY